MVCRIVCLILVIAVSSGQARAQSPGEPNTVLMHATFKLSGRAKDRPGYEKIGTAFVLGTPFASDANNTRFYRVLLTAAHVLTGIAGDHATLHLRKKTGDIYEPLLVQIKIRDNGRPLWKQHPSADVAVMYLPVPNGVEIPVVSTNLLADDESINKFGLHPGDRLACLGYPYDVASNGSGFPILRSGFIASFPLIPTKTVKEFYFDFHVFPGNSGGPVYFTDTNRMFNGTVNIGTEIFMIVGLVTQLTKHQESIPIREKDGKKAVNGQHIESTSPIGLGTVIHGSIIRETIDLLPAQPL